MSGTKRPLHLQPPTGINILPPSPIDPTHSSPFREPKDISPLAADALSASPSNDPALLLPKESPLEGAPLRRVPSPSSPDYRPQRTHHRRTSSTHQVRETVDGSQTTTEDGRLVNQYKIGRSLGQGAYAKVELGVDVTTGKEYAIKEFSKSRLSYHALQERQRHSARSRLRKAARRKAMEGTMEDPEKTATPVSGGPWSVNQDTDDDPLGLIRREIAVMKKLDHPNLIHLYEAISVPDADALFLVLEYLPGGTLMEVHVGGDTSQAKSPFSRDQSREYFRQLCLGLEYLHHNEVVHRDIKPDNILLSADREIVKLCDFGVSEMFEGDDRIRHTGGSPAFLSPESFQTNTAEVHGKAVDIWALGVTLYCMLTGKLPFNVENPIDLFEAVKTHEPLIPTDWSREQADLVKRMLIKNPADRIRMSDIRSHAWVTESGTEAMISKDDNLYYVGQQVEEPTPEELGLAIRPRKGIFTLIRAVQKMRRLGHLRRSLSGQTSGSSLPGSMDSYMSNTSDDTSATDIDEDRLKGTSTSSPDFSDSDLPLDQQDTPGVRATLRESLRRLKVETDLHHHSRHTHHQESTHRHVHHIHHLKHHIRRSGDMIRGMDSRGIERMQKARGMITDSPVSDDPDVMGKEVDLDGTGSSDATLRMADLAVKSGEAGTSGEAGSSAKDLPARIDSPEPTDSPAPMDSPTPVDSPETVDSPELMDSPGLVDSPIDKEPTMVDSPSNSPVNDSPTIMDSPTGL